MVKKSFVSMRPSDIPRGQWIKVVLLNPSEYRLMAIRRSGMYVAYKAYFVNEYITEKKVFDIVFPYDKFQRAMKAIDPKLRIDLTKPIQFEFMYTPRYNIFVKGWEQI